jgi:hypothetical protein
MSFKCPFCSRIFSRRTAYTQHKNICILTAESSEEYSGNEEIKYNLLNFSESSKSSKKSKLERNSERILESTPEPSVNFENTFEVSNIILIIFNKGKVFRNTFYYL